MTLLIQKGIKNVSWQGIEFDCLVGKNGFTPNKIEGDKKTPIGRFKMTHVYYRPDIVDKPYTNLPISALTSDMGWSDDVNDPNYNQLVKLPHNFSHEKLYRNDSVYDLLITTSHNSKPIVPGKGSAIFIHSIGINKEHTDGCLALHRNDLLHIIRTATIGSEWLIGDNLA